VNNWPRWRLRALALSLALAAAPSVAAGQTIGGVDSASMGEVLDLISRANPELDARRAALAAAEARVPAAGALGPAVLSAELEEVPDGFDVSEAGSFRLDLSRELLGGGRKAASRAAADQAVARARLELALVERGLLARIEGLIVHYLGSLTIAERLSGQDSLLAGAEGAVTARFAVGEGATVPVPREWLLDLLAIAVTAPATGVPMDPTVEVIASRYGRAASTIRGWCEAGRFSGAYKLNGREWRIPPSALEAFEAQERRYERPSGVRGGRAQSLSDWRHAS
jgi:hypothetical protein